MAALQTLDLSGCHQLTALPESVGQMAALQTLELRYCSALRELPGMTSLTALVVLDIHKCASLEAIPSLSHLPELKVIMDDLHGYLGCGLNCASVSNTE
jgi:Leucine-rich repeat (LRR) protein